MSKKIEQVSLWQQYAARTSDIYSMVMCEYNNITSVPFFNVSDRVNESIHTLCEEVIYDGRMLFK